MKKKLLFICVCVFLLIACAISVSADDKHTGFEFWESEHVIDESFEYKLNSDNFTATIVDYRGSNTAIIIPDHIDKYVVTSIGQDVFAGLSLISITIPATIENIDPSAFYYCELANITVSPLNRFYKSTGNCLIHVSSYTLIRGCNNSIVPSDGSVVCVGFGAFSGCSTLSNCVIPHGVTTIDDYAFEDCVSLTSVTIPDSVTCIGEYAFSNCENLSNINFPKYLESIGFYAFYNCLSFTNILLPDSVTTIRGSAFNSCQNVTNLKLPSNLQTIGNFAFYNCNKLEKVVIPDNVTSLGGNAFASCVNLSKVILNNGLVSIGSQAFAYCSNLSEIFIPSTVENIGFGVFGGCTALNSIDISADNLNYCAMEGVLYNKNCNILICYPDGKGDNFSIPVGVTTIERLAFYCCYNLKNVTIPNTVTYVGESAFASCRTLENIYFMGDAPQVGQTTFSQSRNIYYRCNTEGWNADVWKSYKCFINHEEVIDNAIDPTCTESGLTKGSHCSLCDIVFIAQKEVPATGHKLKGYDAQDATCEEIGWNAYKTCTTCGYSTCVDIPALGHDFSPQWTVDVEPTTTTLGQKSRHCSRCNVVTDIIEFAKLVEIIDTSKKFTDVSATSWAKPGIDYVVSYGYMNGTGNGSTFSPSGTMTRAMIVSVLHRIAEQLCHSGNNPFTDLDTGWYYDAVLWAYENGIVTGTSTTTFSPNGDVTREQMATFLYRFAKYMGYDVSKSADLTAFPDESKVGSWAYNALAWANAEALITGAKGDDGVTRLEPQSNATREQVATILTRFCKVFEE